MLRKLVLAVVILLCASVAHGYDLPAPIPLEPGTHYQVIQHKGAYISPNVRLVTVPSRKHMSHFRAIYPWKIRMVRIYVSPSGRTDWKIEVYRKGK